MWFTSTAHAEAPLPSYREALVSEAWDRVDASLERGDHDAAVAMADAFQRVVCEDGGIEYLVGLSYRLRDQNAEAKRHYQRAVALDPAEQAAWNDLGELWIAEGDWANASAAFERVSTLVPSGPYGWIGPWRLAEIAAHQHQPEPFEAQLRLALSRGFSFRLIVGLENWRSFYQDPIMHGSVEKLVTVYAPPDVLDALRAPTSEKTP
jgi:tetratricopeptide (TPR) repeat protein